MWYRGIKDKISHLLFTTNKPMSLAYFRDMATSNNNFIFIKR